MKYVKYEMSAGYCGTEKTVYAKFDDDATDDEIGHDGEEMAWDHVQMYDAEEEWEEENPDVEFELDYSWSYVTEKEYNEADDADEKQDFTRGA